MPVVMVHRRKMCWYHSFAGTVNFLFWTVFDGNTDHP